MNYTIFIDPKYKLKKYKIINKILDVIHDRRGWKKLGYKFNYIEYEDYLENNIKLDFIIMFKTNYEINNICHFDGQSCADTLKNEIYINIENWKKGSSKSKLSLDDYRNMVITHEIGHILGRDHVKPGKKNTKISVMAQQTLLGIGDCKPNCWPLMSD
jgi:hypothetical protein